MSAPQSIAAPDTVLALLQSGRGEGYRRALGLPRAEAHELLIKCITRDPRIDSQCESRREYYAAIAIESELPLEPLAEYLRENDNLDQNPWVTINTLSQLAKANYGNSRKIICDYIQWGREWDWAVEDILSLPCDELHQQIARAVELRFPADDDLDKAMQDYFSELACFSSRIGASLSRMPKIPAEGNIADLTSLSPAEILDLANRWNYRRLGEAIAEIVGPSDVDFLVSRVSLQTPFSSHVALMGLKKIAPAPLAQWLCDFLLTIPCRSAPDPANFPQTLLRRGVIRAMLSLPAAATLPIARDWITQEDLRKRELAEEILIRHATAEDLPILRKFFVPILNSEEPVYRCLLFQAFYNLPNVGIVPELIDIFYHFPYSRGRFYAAKAIQITSPDFFASSLALECLWDCEAGTRELGAQIAPLESSEALQRIRHLAEDAFEDEDVRAAAKSRLESVTFLQRAG